MKVLAADYTDQGQWGILTEDNRIIVAYSDGLTKDRAKVIADRINRLLEEVKQRAIRESSQ
jgi:hypothetical protein